jgi:formylglycine-generating enzyme required for sulfatase activity
MPRPSNELVNDPRLAGAGVSPRPFKNLHDLLHAMTGDERVERAVAAYAQQAAAEWMSLRQGNAPPDYTDNPRLDAYVEPQLSILVPHGKAPRGRPTYQRLDGGVDQLIQDSLLRDDRWLIVTEDAGGGKTVLTWRLRAGLSAWSPSPFLAVRFERHWPTDFRAALESAIGQCRDITPAEVVSKLLEQRRIVVILDAFDQASRPTQDELDQRLAGDETLARQLRVILTSRPNAVSERRANHFAGERWQFVRLELFSEQQQADYRAQLPSDVQGHWSRVVAFSAEGRREAEDVLRYPIALRMIREYIETTPKSDLRPFRNRADLYWKVSQTLLDRAYRGAERTKRPEDRGLLTEIIAGIAIEMMLRTRSDHGHSVPQLQIADLKRAARRRFQGTEAQWDRCDTILQDTYLTDHSVLKENSDQELSFPSLRMLEFFAGVYLARYATAGLGADVGPHIGDDRWYWPWRFAIELDEQDTRIAQDDSLAASLPALFQPPKSHLRPTELMFRAWQVLERGGRLDPRCLTVRDRVLGGYRRQFVEILTGESRAQASLAAQLLPESRLQALANGTGRRVDDPEELRAAWPSYVACPPSGDRLTFWMGTSCDAPGFDEEQPRHRVSTAAFEIAACAVTRAQYCLFDPWLERVYRREFERISPDSDCPVIMVHWFDAFCFALWLGEEAFLPSETEWEGAARGGRDGPRDTIGIPPYDESFGTDQVNFDGNYPLSGDKSGFLKRTLPVRWDTARKSQYLQTASLTATVPVYQANAFGIWHAQGNVWEWCRSPEDSGLYARRAALGAPDLAETEDVAVAAPFAKRVLRGGSWLSDAIYCRSACRDAHEPDARLEDCGFRLGWRRASD